MFFLNKNKISKHLSFSTAILSALLLSASFATEKKTSHNIVSHGISKAIPGYTEINNGLAQTPPMGWSSWNNFGVEINEQLIIETIDAMVNNGMQKAGFNYVNLDDGWQRYKGSRKDYPLEYDPIKFPRGIKYLADYAHRKGIKLGIYSGPGETTCAGYTGSEGNEKQDAAMFASWGIDHLKYDSCCSHENAKKPVLQKIFHTMSAELQAQKHDVVLHACHCGWGDIWEWAGTIGANHWRIGQDISDDFDYPKNREGYYFDVLDMIDRGIGLEKYSGPGRWNDFDMLIVGLNGKSKELVGAGASNIEYRSHFSMWAMLSSPMLTGTDLRDLDPYTLTTLTNAEVTALNQDALGIQAAKVKDYGDYEIFAKPLADGSWAVALLNRGSTTIIKPFNWKKDLAIKWDKVEIRDLWKHTSLGIFEDPLNIELISHDTKVFKISVSQ